MQCAFPVYRYMHLALKVLEQQIEPVKPFPFQTQFDFEYIHPPPSKSPGAKFYAEWIKEMIGVGWGLRIWKEEEEKRVWVGGGE